MFFYPNREKFLEAVKNQLEPNIFKHSLAVEACMNGIYDYLFQSGDLASFEPKKEEWLLAGLIHDVDYSDEFKPFHPNKTLEVLKKYNLTISETVHKIIKAHVPKITGYYPKNKAEWALFCCDSLTGLIVAVALVYPSKKLADVKLSSVIKRFLKEPRFASGTRREDVKKCELKEGLNIPLEKFIEICLEEMKKISKEIGL
ncbi:MAG: HD domain-containing protein [Patescibacteria group bacterium]|nr:HD domain-containing protein [Patescibacteria group bacterium]